MKIQDVLYAMGNGASYIFAAVQTNEVLQIISFILSTVTSVVLIVLRLVSWYKGAKADGKITKEEIDEAIDIVESSRKDKD